MAQSGFRQDMPPPGGYASIQFKRVPLKSAVNGPIIFTAYIGSLVLGTYMLRNVLHARRKQRVETYDVNIALEPLLTAERDRTFLLQLIQNREDERELMKNIPGWEVGKALDGQPLYKTIPEDFYITPVMNEYYAHSMKWYMQKSRYFSFHFS